MKEEIIKNVYEAIIKEIQTVITLSYILAVGIGMLFNYQKYAEFEINIFDYSDVFDFLIAPFSDSNILLFAVASIISVFLLIQLDTVWKRKSPESYSRANFGLDKKKWFSAFRYFTFAIAFILYLYLSADLFGKYAKSKVENQQPISIRFADNEIKMGKLIGKTKDILFLLKNGHVKAIPLTSLVKEIELK